MAQLTSHSLDLGHMVSLDSEKCGQMGGGDIVMLWAQEAEEVKLVRGSRLCQGTDSRLVMYGWFLSVSQL